MRLRYILPVLFMHAFGYAEESKPASLTDDTIARLYSSAQKLVADQFEEQLQTLPRLVIKGRDSEAAYAINAEYLDIKNSIRFFRDGFIENYRKAYSDDFSKLEDAALLVLCHELVHAYQYQHGFTDAVDNTSPSTFMTSLIKGAMLESHAVFIQSRIADLIGAADVQARGVASFRQVTEGIATAASDKTEKAILYTVAYRYVFGPSLYQKWFNESQGTNKSRLQEQFGFAAADTLHFGEYTHALAEYLSARVNI